MLDRQTIDIPCQNCARKHKKTIAWIKANNKLTCSCGAVTSLESSDFRSKIAAAEKSLKSLFK